MVGLFSGFLFLSLGPCIVIYRLARWGELNVLKWMSACDKSNGWIDNENCVTVLTTMVLFYNDSEQELFL